MYVISNTTLFVGYCFINVERSADKGFVAVYIHCVYVQKTLRFRTEHFKFILAVQTTVQTTSDR